jgi:hypothetical protein
MDEFGGATGHTIHQRERDMSDILWDRIEREADSLENVPRLGGATPDLLARADHAARYFDLYYEPGKIGDTRRPGLRDADLPETLGAEIRRIKAELERADVDRFDASETSPKAPARAIVSEIRDLLAWRADEDPSLAARLDGLARLHRRAQSAERVMVALSEYTLLARAHEERLRRLGAFDPAMLDGAETLMRDWAERPRLGRKKGDPRAAALAILLRRRVRLVVRAAALVFRRRYPDLAAEAFTERQRRANANRTRARRAARTGAATSVKPAAAPATPDEPTP